MTDGVLSQKGNFYATDLVLQKSTEKYNENLFQKDMNYTCYN